MKKPFLAAAMAATLVSGAAFAACTGNLAGANAIGSAVNGKTVCVGSQGAWQNQELHSNSNIIDYKMGPNDARDPSKQIGTYAITGNGNSPNATITYTYTPGGTFGPYTVDTSALPAIYLCTGTTVAVTATVKATTAGCN